MGGGIVFVNTSKVRVRYCYFKNNTSRDLLGGGIGIENCRDVLIDSCTFELNQGSGLSFDGATNYRISNCTFVNNSSTEGGGMRLSIVDSGIVEHCTFRNNRAEKYGGAFCSLAPSVNLSQCLFEYNSASYDGNAIFCNNSSTAIFKHCTIRNNRNMNTVSAMSFWYLPLTIIDACKIIDNPCQSALNFYQCDTVTISGSAIHGNRMAIIRDTISSSPKQPIAAQNNWWGTNSGPFHAEANPLGQGDTVCDLVKFRPWTTITEIDHAKLGQVTHLKISIQGSDLIIKIPFSFSIFTRSISITLCNLRGQTMHTRICDISSEQKKLIIPLPKNKLTRGIYGVLIQCEGGYRGCYPNLYNKIIYSKRRFD